MVMDIEALVAYAAEGAPDFQGRIKGSSPERIARLQALAGPLPGAYRLFLTKMGEDQGGLDLHDRSRTRLDEVIAFYERIKGREHLRIPSGAVLIGVGQASDLVLINRGEGDCAVALAQDGEVVRRLSESFEKFLFRRAFQARLARRPFLAALEGQNVGPRLSEAAAGLKTVGLEPLWFSERDVVLAESKQALVRLQANPPALFAEIGASTPEKLEELAAGLGRFGLASD